MKVISLFVLTLMLWSTQALTQEQTSVDEVPVSLNVQRIGTTEMSVLIKNNKDAYLPVKDLFDYLKIKNNISAHLDSISGFFIKQDVTYLIDYVNLQISYSGEKYKLTSEEIISTETNLYLKAALFERVFGLNCDFSFRNLCVTVKTELELPAIREMQQEQLRKNINQLKGDKKADLDLKREFKAFEFGVADWSVTGMQQTKGDQNLRLNLALGGTVAGGDAEVNLNYFSDEKLNGRQQYFRWRHVNDNFGAIRQMFVGRIAASTISSLFAPINGIQLTNAPTGFRKAFGTHRYTGTTQPGWLVELYVNNILVNYVKADASGFYVFDIPILYGNSAVRLRFYGPWGEESSKEENIVIPFNFLPPGEFQYLLSAGIVANDDKSRYMRADANFGLTKKVTVGGGFEFVSSVMQAKPMPFMNASIRLASSLIVNGEYVHKVRTKATFNYRLPWNFQVDGAMVRYDQEQTAIIYNYREERKASVTVPFRFRKIGAFSKLSFNQYTSLKNKTTSTEFLLSSVVGGISSNFRTYAQLSNTTRPVIYSNLSFSFTGPHGIRVNPQVQYQYTNKNFTLFKFEAEKRISYRGTLNVGYESHLNRGSSNVSVGLRLNLSFAQTMFGVKAGSAALVATESVKGSFLYNRKSDYVDFSDQVSLNKGALILLPFLDINGNGKKDSNEPKVFGLNVRINGGRPARSLDDSTLIIQNLEPYTNYFIEMDESGFDNIAWKMKYRTMNVFVEPNRIRLVEVPVSVVGEASGMVYLISGNIKKGLSRVIVNFYDTANNRVGQTLTENDGYFNLLGLPPGSYKAVIDSLQLDKLKLTSDPGFISFKLIGSEEGAVADNFEFNLRSVYSVETQTTDTTNVADSSNNQPTKNRQPVVREKEMEQTSVSRPGLPVKKSVTKLSTVPATPSKTSRSRSKLPIASTPDRRPPSHKVQSGKKKPIKSNKVSEAEMERMQREMEKTFRKPTPQPDKYERWLIPFPVMKMN